MDGNIGKQGFSISRMWQERNAEGTTSARLWEFFKFCVAGCTGFLIDFGLLHLLCNIWGMQPLAANAISFTISVVVNYLMCAFWVFRGSQKRSTLTAAAFILTSLIGLGFNELLMFLFLNVLGSVAAIRDMVTRAITLVAAPDGVEEIRVLAAKAITTILVFIWNYFSKRKVLTYKKNKPCAENAPKQDEDTLPA